MVETRGPFPQTRMRRNRSDDWTRRLVAEHRLSADDLIWPVFLREDDDSEAEIASMPGQRRLTVSEAVDAVGRAAELGIPAIGLFPKVRERLKTPACEEAVNPDNLICRGLRALKTAVPQVGLVGDVALDPFNPLGHDGLLDGERVLNDETVEILCRQALVQAQAGCDVIAPSDMMDGRIAAIRRALDQAGLQDTRICSYAAKYASAFYGPFRDAIGSSGALKGDKKTYQMDPANSDEALHEVALDLAEGADMVMVKPGLPYLDIIRRVKERFAVPTFAYQVSGEYAMIKAAALNGWLDGERAMMESLVAFKRAGADAVLTYFAVEAAKRLRAG
ncbi:porphobilinogen synthase [Tistlia consotensis]|uniref:Delta-aminolevulinic acid dehydratase n=1 Tax=Tistlia consotensis USBA 355 TaxID=560819 RepID=A0A1Y6CA39_9PROT|nr:porphobilinogen synthase [Tistlia consotensis]SMF44094.1 porphobilinogen synthase [Tistlia consotensis USBA 355]SNR43071.1 porphobilinogen synthase [Tistlia consotensis]